MNRRISIAASALVHHVAHGGWIGASPPMYLKEFRQLHGRFRSIIAVYRLAARRYNDKHKDYFWTASERNFLHAYEEQYARDEAEQRKLDELRDDALTAADETDPNMREGDRESFIEQYIQRRLIMNCEG